MKKEAAQKWVEALRSGKYKQGVGMLRNAKDEYCCLGVLCDINGFSPMYTDFYVPKELQSILEMKSSIGTFKSANKFQNEYNLSKLNDDGVSFLGIADLIEKNWENI